MRRWIYYLGLLPLALLMARILGIFHQKLQANLRARKGLWQRLKRVESLRDPEKPLVWFHVASAGEFLQAEPIMLCLQQKGVQLAITVTSLSGLGWTKRISHLPEVIWADMLPWDFSWNLNRMLTALRPMVVVYLQADLWPGMVWETHHRAIPQVLLAARMNEGSLKHNFPLLREFYRGIYVKIAIIMAASRVDLERFLHVVPDHPGLGFGGDPGIETVLNRVHESPLPILPPGFEDQGTPTVVAGSSWPADERQIFPVLKELMRTRKTLRLIIAPHEPEEERLRAIEAFWAPEHSVRLTALDQPGGSQEGFDPNRPIRVILVDSVGRLASLYRLGTVAFVGGGFGAGVHNVAEPAAAGLPVMFGPRYGKSAAAQELILAKVGFSVVNELSFKHTLVPLLENLEKSRAMGLQSKKTVGGMTGAVERSYNAILQASSSLREVIAPPQQDQS